MLGLQLRPRYSRQVAPERRAAGQPNESMFVGLAEGIPQWGRDDYDRFARESYGRIPLVYAVINAIATSAAEARLRPMVGSDKNRKELTNVPIANLLKKPNRRQGWYAFGVSYHTAMQYSGNAFIYKPRNAAGVPVQMRILRTGRMQIVPGPNGDPQQYIHRIDGKDYPIAPQDIIHIKRDDPADDWFGLSPLHVLARSTQIKVEMQKVQWASFHNGGVMSGILTMDRELDDDEPDEYRRQWRQQFSGLQAGGIAVFGASLKYQQIAMNLDMMAMPDLQHMSDTDICCLPGTEIITRAGLISIEAIHVGDEVLTHRGRWRQVLRTMISPSSGRPIVETTAKGFEPLRTTADHPVYAAHFSRNRVNRASLERFDWTQAGSLQPRNTRRRGRFDALVLPMLAPGTLQPVEVMEHLAIGRHIPVGVINGRVTSNNPLAHSLPASVPLTAAFGRLLGYYLAEGSQGRHGTVLWYFHREEVAFQNQVLADLREVFGLDGMIVEKGSVTVVKVSCALLSELLGKKTAHTKAIPSWAWEGDDEFRAALLNAWIDGDGHRYERDRVIGTTVSRDLAWGMRLLAISLGYPASVRSYVQKDAFIDGRRIRGGPCYDVAWHGGERGQTGSYRFEGHYLTGVVKSVAPIEYDGPVYNLEVEDDNSYVTTGGTVHNCSVFQTPPSVVYALISQTRGAAIGAGGAELEDQRKWWENCLNPEMRLLMEGLTIGLQPDFGTDWELDADTSKIRALQDDEDAKSSRILSLWNGGLYTRDLALMKLGEEPIGGRAGTVYRIPSNVEEKTAEEMDEIPEPPPPMIHVMDGTASPDGTVPAALPSGRPHTPELGPVARVPGQDHMARQARHQALIEEARAAQIAPAITVFTDHHRKLADRAAGLLGRKTPVAPSVLIPAEADAQLATELRTLALRTAEATWRAANDSGLVGDVPWQPHTPVVQAIIKRSGERAEAINARARAGLAEMLRLGESRGYDRRQIANGVTAETYPGVRSLLTEFYRARAPQLARAEVNRITRWTQEARVAANLTADGSPSESTVADNRDGRTRAFAAALLALWRRLQAGEITRQEYDAEVAKLAQSTSDAMIKAVADREGADVSDVLSGGTAHRISTLIAKSLLVASAGAALFRSGVEPPSDAMAQKYADQAAGALWAAEHVAEAGAQPEGSIGTWEAEDDANTCGPCSQLDGQEFTPDDVPEIGEVCEGELLCRCKVNWTRDPGRPASWPGGGA